MAYRLGGMNLALRELCNEGSSAGEGPIEVLTRVKDFNVVTVENPQGGQMNAPADSLIAFTAYSFRELSVDVPADPDDATRRKKVLSGVWEFRVQVPTKEGAPPTTGRLFLCGADILTVRALSKVLG